MEESARRVAPRAAKWVDRTIPGSTSYPNARWLARPVSPVRRPTEVNGRRFRADATPRAPREHRAEFRPAHRVRPSRSSRCPPAHRKSVPTRWRRDTAAPRSHRPARPTRGWRPRHRTDRHRGTRGGDRISAPPRRRRWRSSDRTRGVVAVRCEWRCHPDSAVTRAVRRSCGTRDVVQEAVTLAPKATAASKISSLSKS